MAYTAYKTWTVGEVLTAANMNAQVRDNGLLGPEALATADGEVWIATGANAGEMVAILDSSNALKHEYGGLEADVSAITTGGTLVGQSAGVIGIETLMTQDIVEAGTDTQVRGVSALIIKQGIDYHAGTPPTEATQANMEAEATGFLLVPPDLIKYSPGVAKVWGSITTAGAIESPSYNVASLTDTGPGNRTLVIDNDMSSVVYVVVQDIGEVATATHVRSMHGSKAVGSVRLVTARDAAIGDASHSVAIFGDL